MTILAMVIPLTCISVHCVKRSKSSLDSATSRRSGGSAIALKSRRVLRLLSPEREGNAYPLVAKHSLAIGAWLGAGLAGSNGPADAGRAIRHSPFLYY